MPDFRIHIVHPGFYKIKRRIIFFHALAVVMLLITAFAMIIIRQGDYWVPAFCIAAGMWILVRGILLRKSTLHRVGSIIGLRTLAALALLTAGILLVQQHYYMAGILQCITGICFGMLAVIEYNACSPAFIAINEKCIQVPSSFGRQTYGWKEMNAVILRNDLLTLDFRNNRVLQLEIKEDLDTDEARELQLFLQQSDRMHQTG